MVTDATGDFAIGSGNSHTAMPSDTPLESQTLFNWPKNRRIVTGSESSKVYGFMIFSFVWLALLCLLPVSHLT